jgi:LmbE family N-acetylglucosaminyl deacetylase
LTEALLLAPHGDDETLFAAFTCMRYGKRMHVIVCTQDADPAIRGVRSMETKRAISLLGCTHHEWPMSADEPNWDSAKEWLGAWASDKLFATRIEKVFAPAIEVEGHEQHNAVGLLAQDVFGDRVTHYLTYGPRGERSQHGVEVAPPTAHEIVRKLRALSCYESQITNPCSMPWFFDLLDMREWWAAE